MNETQSPAHRNAFDFLRLVAATLVMYGHAFPLFGMGGGDVIKRLIPPADAGSIGVAIFFSISGYLNAKSVQRSDVATFYIHRAVRIFPGLVGALLFCTFVVGPLCTNLPLAEYFKVAATYRYLLDNSFLSINYGLPGVFSGNHYPGTVNGSLWTLPSEVALYLALPFVMRAFAVKARAMVIAACGFFTLHALCMGFDVSHVNVFGLGNPLLVTANAMEFFIGAALSQIEPPRVPLRAAAWWGFALLVLSRTQYGSLAYLVVLPMFSVALGTSGSRKMRVKHDISYGIYIYAFPVQQMIQHFLGGLATPTVMLLAAYVATATLALGSWFFVEQPLLLRRAEVRKFLLPGKAPVAST